MLTYVLYIPSLQEFYLDRILGFVKPLLHLMMQSDGFRLSALNPSGPGLALVERLLITTLISLEFVDLFKLFIWSWFNFGSGMYQKFYPFLWDFLTWWSKVILSMPSQLSISFVSVCPLLFSNFINLYFLYLLVYLAKGLFNILNFLKVNSSLF